MVLSLLFNRLKNYCESRSAIKQKHIINIWNSQKDSSIQNLCITLPFFSDSKKMIKTRKNHDGNYLDFQSFFIIIFSKFMADFEKRFYPAKIVFSNIYSGLTKTFRSRWRRTTIDMNNRWPWMPRHLHITCVQYHMATSNPLGYAAFNNQSASRRTK